MSAAVAAVQRMEPHAASGCAAEENLTVLSTARSAATEIDVDKHLHALRTDGVTALKGAFAPAWADAMCEDIEAAFEDAIRRRGGAVGRGPNRYYVEIHPQA